MRTLRGLLGPALAIVLLQCSCGGGVTPGTGDGGKHDGGSDSDTPPTCTDDDGDGYGNGCTKGPDCDDGDPTIHPGADEICDDNIDNDCDGETDEDTAGEPCVCRYGMIKECYEGPDGTADVGVCHKGMRRCGDDGTYSPCEGQVLPADEECDGKDNDCDGETDEGVRNACGTCGTVSAEVCFDGLDNNCDGVVDEGCGTCDPQCLCVSGNCTCHPPTNQPCYTGPPQTSGQGLCHQGKMDCLYDAGSSSWKWGPCVGQVLPAAPLCDGADRDCDGLVDDGLACPCNDGAQRSCGSDVGECQKGVQACSGGAWGACQGGREPTAETCDGLDNDCDGLIDNGVTNACGGCGPVPDEVCEDGLDNNCNGLVDEGCTCTPLATQSCFRGPEVARGQGECRDGTQTCVYNELGNFWGPCVGDQLPVPEVCGDDLDNDCDGVPDNGCDCDEGDTRRCGTDVGECQRGTQTCTNGHWGTCVGETAPTDEVCDYKDNDCDGLTDEGVLNSCGKCPPEPCYEQDYPTPGDCGPDQGRTCDGVGDDPDHPGSVTLNQGTNTLYPYAYISVTDLNQVAQFNTETFLVERFMASHGISPSRTAVALDGTVWVGNRCLLGNEYDPTCSNLVHLALDGTLICRADIPRWVRGVAIDADGNVWAGTWNGMSVWKVSGTIVDAGDPPQCRILNPGGLNVGANVYGLAVDGRGYLWTASNPAKKINVQTIAVEATVSHGRYYGVAVDKQHRVWFGGWSGGGTMHRLDGDTFAEMDTGATGVTAVTMHPDGSAWGSRYGAPTGVQKITMDAAGNMTNSQSFADPSGYENHGVAVDRAGYVWTSQRFGEHVNRWDPATGAHLGAYPIVSGVHDLYTYSDYTGTQLRTITVREGNWYQVYDAGYAPTTWDHVEWTAIVPTGTSVQVQLRAANAESDFGAGLATAWCGPFVTPVPSSGTNTQSLAACSFLNGHRYVQVDLKLNTTVDGVRPSVSDVKVFWSY